MLKVNPCNKNTNKVNQPQIFFILLMNISSLFTHIITYINDNNIDKYNETNNTQPLNS